MTAPNPFAFLPSTGGGSGRHAHVFHPPKSPATTAATPPLATATDYFGAGPRKRLRPESSQLAQREATPNRPQLLPPGDGSYHSHGFGQGTALVNERYRLAGGYDTPSLQATADMENMGLSEADLSRRRLRDDVHDVRPRYDRAMMEGPLARERNGVARMPMMHHGMSPPSTTWTGMAFNLVGKVFTFGSSMIQGIYAGQGEGFDFRHDARPDLFASHEKDEWGCSTPVPGSWQDDEFLGDFEQDNPSSSQVRPTNKRRQTDRETWVVVGTPDLSDSAPRRPHTGSTAAPRSSFVTSRPQASRASSRRSLAPNLRRQSHIVHTGSPAALPSFDTTTPRRASFAPARSPHSRHNSGEGGFNAYVSPEAERFAKRQAKQDRAADKAMSSMSKKLEDLIRQGQQALGTKISVEGVDLDTDEGFVDEGW